MVKRKTAHVSGHDITDLIDGFKHALHGMGIRMYDDPMFEGSSDYGFILSAYPMNKRQLRHYHQPPPQGDEHGSSV